MPGPFDQGWQRIVIAASGPSFTVVQAELIEAARAAGRCRVLAINATALPPDPEHGKPVGLPNSDALFGADRSFWNEHGAALKASFGGQIWSGCKLSADQLGLKFIRCERRDGLTKDLRALNRGGNSGYAGINLAYLFGMRLGILVGFDMKLGANGRPHHHGNHAGRLANPTTDSLKAWRVRFPLLARELHNAGVDVVNCTIDSALDCFRRADLAEALDAWQ